MVPVMFLEEVPWLKFFLIDQSISEVRKKQLWIKRSSVSYIISISINLVFGDGAQIPLHMLYCSTGLQEEIKIQKAYIF
jgi:hypothetical protein